MDDRAALRRAMRARRRQLDERGRHGAALCLARLLATSGLLRNARRIACYFSCNGEMDLTPVMARIHAMGKQCYLPVLDETGGARLWFALYQPGDALWLNRHGIPEPSRPRQYLVKPWQLDLILAPLVAFDPRGNRLGMGGGYYDRTLAFLLRRRCWHRPRFYGVAYEFQKVAALERRPWDVPLDGVVTEQRIYRMES
ncbi:MAG TPA: 5-formyltetrahydrofolate cyclo-ligase [Gammaproteobacteria bacterium]|nr:5-formyltetrahydrofolate cyclo-ligase [Gammaproteobacteria bacterium]